jgi:hypothetical protein
VPTAFNHTNVIGETGANFLLFGLAICLLQLQTGHCLHFKREMKEHN